MALRSYFFCRSVIIMYTGVRIRTENVYRSISVFNSKISKLRRFFLREIGKFSGIRRGHRGSLGRRGIIFESMGTG